MASARHSRGDRGHGFPPDDSGQWHSSQSGPGNRADVHPSFPATDGRFGIDEFDPFTIPREEALRIAKLLAGKRDYPILDCAPILRPPNPGRQHAEFAVIEKKGRTVKPPKAVIVDANQNDYPFPNPDYGMPRSGVSEAPWTGFRLRTDHGQVIYRQAKEMGILNLEWRYYTLPEIIEARGKTDITGQTLAAYCMSVP